MKQITRARTNSLVSIFSVLAVILGLIFAFGYSVVRNISKPLGSLVEMVEEFEKGHLKKG